MSIIKLSYLLHDNYSFYIINLLVAEFAVLFISLLYKFYGNTFVTCSVYIFRPEVTNIYDLW